MSIVNSNAPRSLIVGKVILEPEPDGSLAARSVKLRRSTTKGTLAGSRSYWRVTIRASWSNLTPNNACDLAAHHTAAATIVGSPVTQTSQT